jgi:hypothetical protein
MLIREDELDPLFRNARKRRNEDHNVVVWHLLNAVPSLMLYIMIENGVK